jgi:hypothetical protein
MNNIKNIYHNITVVPLNEIVKDFIYIGSLYDYKDPVKLLQLGITHILDVSGESYIPSNIDDIKKTFKYVKISMQDTPDFPIHNFFDITVKLLDEVYNTKGKVLVNCHMGKSRSVTIVLNYIMLRYGLSLDNAIAFVKYKRNVIAPNPGFIKQLQLYHSTQQLAS